MRNNLDRLGLFDEAAWALNHGRAGDEAPAPGDFPFTPVPRQRQRKNGWSEDRQRAFITALAMCGSVSVAARHVGMTPRSAHRLLHADGADSFAEAWDAALDEGLARVSVDALDRALHGQYVRVFRRGRLVRIEHRRSDRLAIACLNRRDQDRLNHEHIYPRAADRRAYRRELREHDERKLAEQRELEIARAENHEARMRAIRNPASPESGQPRARFL